MAICALSALARRASSENNDNISAPSRRKVIGLAAIGAIAVAAPVAVIAAPLWDAANWVDRWHSLGCGLEVGGNALHLKGRLNGDRVAIGAMMAEIASPERQTAVIDLIKRTEAAWFPREDPTLRIVRELEAIDAEFISADTDPAGNAAWLERWDHAFDQLPKAAATSGKGRAAKLRYAVEYADTPRGDKLLAQVLRFLDDQT